MEKETSYKNIIFSFPSIKESDGLYKHVEPNNDKCRKSLIFDKNNSNHLLVDNYYGLGNRKSQIGNWKICILHFAFWYLGSSP